jgi:hypothetical protein
MCFPGFHDWKRAESWKWEIRVCQKCGERMEFEKSTGGYSPQPNPTQSPTTPTTHDTLIWRNH